MQANLYAVKYIGSSLASSVSAIYPAISVLLAFFFLKHKISKNTVFGIVLIIGGLLPRPIKLNRLILSTLGFFVLWFVLLHGEVRVFLALLPWKVN